MQVNRCVTLGTFRSVGDQKLTFKESLRAKNNMKLFLSCLAVFTLNDYLNQAFCQFNSLYYFVFSESREFGGPAVWSTTSQHYLLRSHVGSPCVHQPHRPSNGTTTALGHGSHAMAQVGLMMTTVYSLFMWHFSAARRMLGAQNEIHVKLEADQRGFLFETLTAQSNHRTIWSKSYGIANAIRLMLITARGLTSI